MKTIALANQKYGVGKTTTAASLGIGLARQGKKVLLIDADAQGNLTQMLGWAQPDELSPTLANVMGKIITDQPVTPGEGILEHPEGVHLLPANIELSAMEVTLVNTMSRESVLKQYLSSVSDQYDFALIDCIPIQMNKKLKKCYHMATVVAVISLACAVPAVATGTATDPLAIVNNLSDFIFSIIKAIGVIILGWGIVQVGMSIQSHDASQRTQGFLCLFGGLLIAFAKEILVMIGAI